MKQGGLGRIVKRKESYLYILDMEQRPEMLWIMRSRKYAEEPPEYRWCDS